MSAIGGAVAKVNIVTLAAMSPLWFSVVSKEDRSYTISPMPLDSVVGLHKDLLSDAMLIFGDTEAAVRRGVDNAFPGYREARLTKRGASKGVV